MLKFIIKTGLFGALATGVLFASGGIDHVTEWVKDGKEVIEEKVSEYQGMRSELRQIKRSVNGLDSDLKTLKETSIRQDVEIRHIEEEIQQREKSQERLKSNLEKAHSMLGSDAELFRIGSQAYTRTEVERDAADKLRLFKVQEETLSQMRQTYLEHRKTLDLVRESVEQGEALKTELLAESRLLEAQVERYKAREVYVETIAMDFDAREFNTEFGEANHKIAQFKAKLEVKNRMLDERLLVANADEHVTGIDYNSPGEVSVNVLDELTAVLRKGSSNNDSVAAAAITR